MLVHPTFRFLAFWFVMAVYGQPFSPGLSGIYYASLIFIGLPWPTNHAAVDPKTFVGADL